MNKSDNKMTSFILALLLFGSIKAKWGLVEDQGIPILPVNESEEFFQKNQVVFVKFVAAVCKDCSDLHLEYKKLIHQMGPENDIPIVKIDCTEEEAFCRRNRIFKYPSIKMYKNQFSVDYWGKRTAEEMKTWIDQRKDTYIDRLDTIVELEVFNKQRIAVLYMLPEGDLEALNIFMNVAHQYIDVKFAYTYSQVIIDRFSFKSNYSLVFFRQFDEPIRSLVSSSMIPQKRIAAFINHLKYPKILEYSKEVADKLFRERKGSFLLFYKDKRIKEIEDFKKLAIEKHGRALYFTLVNVDTEEGEKMLKLMGVKDSRFPTIRIFKADPKGHNKYMVEDMSYEGLKRTFDDYVHEKLTRYFISSPVPKDNTKLLRTVVGSNFERMVAKSSKFTLVLAYSPDCFSCLALERIFSKLANDLKHLSSLELFKMDASENEYVTFSINDYPTIGFFLPNVPSAIIYKGERTYKALADFMGKIMGYNLLEKKKAEDL